MINKQSVKKYSLGYPLRLLGVTLQTLGVIIAVYMAASLKSWKMIENYGSLNLIIIFAGAIGLASFGLYIYHIGKKMTVKNAETETMDDLRNPVLYLRSFTDDKVAATVVERSPLELNIMRTPPRLTEEEIIANELSRIGPCVAVGSPGERLPTLGMARRYYENDEWQEGVQKLMESAELVVMRATSGITPGFLWELERAVQIVDPKKLLIILPFIIEDEHDANSKELDKYEKFREAANKILPKELPLFSVEMVPWMNLSAILTFQSDWTPKILRLFDIGSTLKESFETISKRYSNHRTV
jgi:hypothetical protein